MRVTRTILSALCAALILVALAPATALAIPRDEVLSRGNVWVVKNVPYSQSYYAYVNGSLVATATPSSTARTLGYRRDCSGFVSMCWNLRTSGGMPLSLDTAGLDSSTLVQPVAKASLAPGDMMLRAKDTAAGLAHGGGHAVIFVGWADPLRNTYYTYEEAGTGVGAVSRIRTYTQSLADGFLPYRYRKVDPDFADVQESISGLNRYETAAAAVEKSFPASTTVSVPVVVIASGETWPDALGGSALAGAFEGPLLLTARNAIPAATRSAITRLKPRRVLLLGGTGTVSQGVESQITAMGIPVTRIAGRDRYAVSRSVAASAVVQARARGRVVTTAYLTTGLNFPDALAVSPISTKTRRPILLTATASLSAETLATIKALRLTDVVILGGTGSVSEKVATQLRSAGIKVSRIGGLNRYDTAIMIAHHGMEPSIGMSWKSLGLSNGNAFADALSGGVAQGQSGVGALMLLTRGERLDEGVARELRDHEVQIGMLRVFGGSGTVLQPTRLAAATILRVTP